MNRRLLFVLSILFCFSRNTTIHANNIEFATHKTASGVLESSFLQQLIDLFQVDIFVETGTYSGETTAQAANLFKQVYTVELHEGMFRKAQQRFAYLSHVKVYQGHSADLLAEIIPTIQKRTLFWLDAHFCGQGTGMGKGGPECASAITAIKEELEVIAKHNRQDCIIMIDDIRGFGSTIDGKQYINCWAYPTVQEVCDSLMCINPNFSCFLIGDIVLAYDKRQHPSVNFSPLVEACTISRLYNGANYTEQQLLDAEMCISKANSDEQRCLEWLYQDQKIYNTVEFHPFLWKGLILLNNQQYNESYNQFMRIIAQCGYENWRVWWYASQAAFKSRKITEARQALDKVIQNQPNFKPAKILKSVINNIVFPKP